MQVDLARELEIACVQTVLDFLVFEALLRELGDVIVGVGGANLRLFSFAVGGDGCEEDVPAGDDGRRPAEARESGGLLDVGRLRPGAGKSGVYGGRVGGGSAETWPFGVSSEGARDKEKRCDDHLHSSIGLQVRMRRHEWRGTGPGEWERGLGRAARAGNPNAVNQSEVLRRRYPGPADGVRAGALSIGA